MKEFVNQILLTDELENKLVITYRRSPVKEFSYKILKAAYKEETDIQEINVSNKIRLRYVEFSNSEVIRTRSIRLPGLVKDVEHIRKFNTRKKTDWQIDYFTDNLLTDRMVKILSLSKLYLKEEQPDNDKILSMNPPNLEGKTVYTDFKDNFSEKITTHIPKIEFKDIAQLSSAISENEINTEIVVVLNGYVSLSLIMRLLDYDVQLYDITDFLTLFTSEFDFIDLSGIYRNDNPNSEFFYLKLLNHFSFRWRKRMLLNLIENYVSDKRNSPQIKSQIDKIFKSGGTELICSVFKVAGSRTESIFLDEARNILDGHYSSNTEFSNAIKEYASYYLVKFNEGQSVIMQHNHDYFKEKPEDISELDWLIDKMDAKSYDWWAAILQVDADPSTRLMEIISNYYSVNKPKHILAMVKKLWKQFEITSEPRILQIIYPTIFLYTWDTDFMKKRNYFRWKIYGYLKNNLGKLPDNVVQSIFSTTFHFYRNNRRTSLISTQELYNIFSLFDKKRWLSIQEETIKNVIKDPVLLELLILGIYDLELVYNFSLNFLNKISAFDLIDSLDYDYYFDWDYTYVDGQDEYTVKWKAIKKEVNAKIKEQNWSEIDFKSFSLRNQTRVVMSILKLTAKIKEEEEITSEQLEYYQLYAVNQISNYYLLERWQALSLGNPIDDVIFTVMLTGSNVRFSDWYEEEKNRMQNFIQSYIKNIDKKNLDHIADIYISIAVSKFEDARIENVDFDYSHYGLPETLDFLISSWKVEHVIELFEHDNYYSPKMAMEILKKTNMVSLDLLPYFEKQLTSNYKDYAESSIFRYIKTFPTNTDCIRLFLMLILSKDELHLLEEYLQENPQQGKPVFDYAINALVNVLYDKDKNTKLGHMLLKVDRLILLENIPEVSQFLGTGDGLASLIVTLIQYTADIEHIDIILLSKIANYEDVLARQLLLDIMEPIITENRRIGFLIPFFESYFEDLNNFGSLLVERLKLDTSEKISLYSTLLDSAQSHTQLYGLTHLFEIEVEDSLPTDLIIRMMENSNSEIKAKITTLILSRYEDVFSVIAEVSKPRTDLLFNYAKSLLFLPNKFRSAKNDVFKILLLAYQHIPTIHDETKELLNEIGSSTILRDKENALKTLIQLEGYS